MVSPSAPVDAGVRQARSTGVRQARSTGAREARSGWRVLPREVADPETLLARGVALLEGLADDPIPTLRWYSSTHTAMVLGRGQARSLAAHSTPAVTVLTRFSGGGAVLMDPTLLSLDVLLPTGHPLLDGDLGAVFGRVGRVWAEALRDLGVPDVIVFEGAGTARRQGDERQRLLAAVCYATLGRGEVLAGDRKLVGLAQRRRRPGALVQCGLLRRWDPGPLLAALGADPDDPEVRAAAVGLNEVAPGISDDEIMQAVQRRLGGEPR